MRPSLAQLACICPDAKSVNAAMRAMLGNREAEHLEDCRRAAEELVCRIVFGLETDNRRLVRQAVEGTQLAAMWDLGRPAEAMRLAMLWLVQDFGMEQVKEWIAKGRARTEEMCGKESCDGEA